MNWNESPQKEIIQMELRHLSRRLRKQQEILDKIKLFKYQWERDCKNKDELLRQHEEKWK